jgi:putative exosortase-associated protein (TIGR04073 family)
MWIAILLVAVLAGATVAFAAEPAADPIERLRDGVQNLATGWLKLFQVIEAETVERGPLPGFFIGSVEGSNQALRQTARGAYDAATFLLPVPRPQAIPSEPGTLLEVHF